MKKKNDFNYYDEFIKTANLAKEAAEELKRYIVDFKYEKAEEQMKKIHEIENKADDNLHELKTYLLRDFLPPIDREDIVAIAHKIDDLVDVIDETVIDINIFNLEKVNDKIINSVELLEKTVYVVNDLVVSMKNLKNTAEIKEKIVEVNKLEEQADRIYENSIKELYKNETNPIEVIKLTNIYETIENCFDACENIAECVEEVLVKNG